MRVLCNFLVACLLPLLAYSQDTLRLKEQLKNTSSAFLKVRMIDSVAYMFMLYTSYDTIGEYYGRQALRVAEDSEDKELIAHALFLNARRVWWDATNKKYRNERFNHYSSELLKLAKKEQLLYYEAVTYYLKGNFHVIQSQFDQGLQTLNHALLIANEIGDDSLIAEIYSLLGEIHTEKGDKVLAFKTLMLGLHIAEKTKDNTCIGNLRRYLARFYLRIGDREKSIQNLLLAKEHLMSNRKQEFESLFWINIDMGDAYRSQGNFEKAVEMYNEVFTWLPHQPVPQPFQSVARLDIFLTLFEQEKYDEARDYFTAHPDIEKLVTVWDFGSMHTLLNAQRHRKQGNYDSSAYYFEKMMPYYDRNNDDVINLNEAYKEYGQVLLSKKDPYKAIEIFKKNLQVAERSNRPEFLREVYKNLDRAYADAGDFKEAYKYRVLYNQYTDSLQGIEKERELSLLEIETENRRQQQLQLEEEEKTRTRHNLQYMAITVAIVLVFTVLLLLGVFTTSAPVIKALGFLAFIMLFEFVILLLDNYIHRVTHGEPWKVLAIKICLIAILFPFHHYIENKIVHHLVTRKKINIRSTFFQKKKPSPAPGDETEPGITYTPASSE